jgi:hypothetical protein
MNTATGFVTIPYKFFRPLRFAAQQYRLNPPEPAQFAHFSLGGAGYQIASYKLPCLTDE